MGQEKGREVSSPWPLGYLGPPVCSALAAEPPPPSPLHPVHLLLGAAKGPQTTPQGSEQPRKTARDPALPASLTLEEKDSLS